MDNYHLVHKDGDWKLELQGSSRASRVFCDCSKKEAVRLSAEILHDGNHEASLRIHGLNGRIQEERSYHISGSKSNVSSRRKSGNGSRNLGCPRGLETLG